MAWDFAAMVNGGSIPLAAILGLARIGNAGQREAGQREVRHGQERRAWARMRMAGQCMAWDFIHQEIRVKINLNDTVRFKLTAHGEKLLPWSLLAKDSGGFVQQQLWVFCNQFGGCLEIGMGGNLIEDNTLEIVKTPLEDDYDKAAVGQLEKARIEIATISMHLKNAISLLGGKS